MIDGLRDLLISYQMGWKTIGDCAEWFAGVDWTVPSELGRQDREDIGELELFSTEYIEGLRAEREFAEAASRITSRGATTIYLPPLTFGANP